MSRDSVEVNVRTLSRTRRAVRVRVAFFQPRDVPEEAIGLRLWFPRASTVLFRDHSGQEVLSVSKSFLLEKIEEATRIYGKRRVA